jgi:hypothetical protein
MNSFAVPFLGLPIKMGILCISDNKIISPDFLSVKIKIIFKELFSKYSVTILPKFPETQRQ